jgi:hypothetical protein
VGQDLASKSGTVICTGPGKSEGLVSTIRYPIARKLKPTGYEADFSRAVVEIFGSNCFARVSNFAACLTLRTLSECRAGCALEQRLEITFQGCWTLPGLDVTLSLQFRYGNHLKYEMRQK